MSKKQNCIRPWCCSRSHHPCLLLQRCKFESCLFLKLTKKRLGLAHLKKTAILIEILTRGFQNRCSMVTGLSKCSLSGNTPLHTAYHTTHNEIARLLIASGADENKTNTSGLRPAQLGKWCCYWNVLLLLFAWLVMENEFFWWRKI